ncbi:hypothetical protein K469DRAFT_685395 [Zopfia rhizophila CBS 207.26]|uniref:Uncharacterized protein n=1 Tax=Zopfia rhizophila CBS 207.26 TaxID=1314779 RepID=A0A6A6D5V3_9PEZI|nr:hypothetical protein K469DRAFT_685395 [Zopfia rhizophila CBS 207.26]
MRVMATPSKYQTVADLAPKKKRKLRGPRKTKKQEDEEFEKVRMKGRTEARMEARIEARIEARMEVDSSKGSQKRKNTPQPDATMITAKKLRSTPAAKARRAATKGKKNKAISTSP